MRRVFAGLLAVSVVGTSGGLGTGTAQANPWYPQPCPGGPYPAESCLPASPLVHGSTAATVYAVGGARAPGIPWYEYTMRAGADWFPDARRELIEYPAGAPFSWMPQFVLPPGPRDEETIGEAATLATSSLDQAIVDGSGRQAGQQAVVGLSQGTLALDQVQARLADDPNAPSPDQLTFTTIGDPTGKHAFGQSFLSEVFGPGEYIPLIDYTMPPETESQYSSNRVVAMYDGLADFPDRPQNVFAVANAVAGSAITHTPAAFTSPDIVPPQNIRSEVNSKGATTTSFLIPVTSLPLTLPLRYLGVPGWSVDMLDGALQPIIDAGYSRNDDPATRPVTVTPAGMDPIGSLDPGTRASIEKTFADVRNLFGVLG